MIAMIRAESGLCQLLSSSGGDVRRRCLRFGDEL
jgi:hypothetical protein